MFHVEHCGPLAVERAATRDADAARHVGHPDFDSSELPDRGVIEAMQWARFQSDGCQLEGGPAVGRSGWLTHQELPIESKEARSTLGGDRWGTERSRYDGIELLPKLRIAGQRLGAPKLHVDATSDAEVPDGRPQKGDSTLAGIQKSKTQVGARHRHYQAGEPTAGSQVESDPRPAQEFGKSLGVGDVGAEVPRTKEPQLLASLENFHK